MKINKTITHFRLMSDLHVEFTEYLDVVELNEDHTSLLILAGDFHVGSKGVIYLEQLAKQFSHIIYVLGNHEHYKQNIEYTQSKIEDELKTIFFGRECNITVVGDIPELIEFDNLRVLAGTLWTDMNGSDPLTKMQVADYLNDYHIIRNGTRKLIPDDTIATFHQTVEKFGQWLSVPFEQGPTVVVTHHLPSQGAVDPRYQSEDNYKLNGGYRSNLDDFIHRHQPNYWCFGHSHSTTDKLLGESRLISNPRGYPSRNKTKFKMTDELIDTEDFENPTFDPLFRIAVV
jgi:hypothetical protein